MTYTATYSPEDNKLRLYPAHRLDKEEYERVKAAGFKWAPKQELFVAPMWTPEREDLLLELCGEIDDEDTSLVERAEERADRFSDYSVARAKDADQAHAAVKRIADMIPFGQPILVGHHSEKHARKDAERIQSGMRKAVSAWNQSKYWEDRAKGALRHAKYKERPDVRARRIKGVEADKRKQEKSKKEAEMFLKLWSAEGLTHEQAIQIANICWLHLPRKEGDKEDFSYSPTAYDALTNGHPNLYAPRSLEEVVQGAKNVYPSIIARCDRWLAHLENRLTYERTMLANGGGTVADKTGPEKGGACKCWCSPRGGWSYIQKVNKVSVTVLDNWGNGGQNFTRTIPFTDLKAVMSKAEVEEKREAGVLTEDEYKRGFYLLELPSEQPKEDPETQQEKQDEMIADTVAKAQPGAKVGPFTISETDVQAMRESLRAGVQVQVVDQLFPTPQTVVQRMLDLALDGVIFDDQMIGGPYPRVLEPSAGTGVILDSLRERGVTNLCYCETNIDLVAALRRKGYDRPLSQDFLECSGWTFDRIIMNPPFHNGADIKHILHARTLLKPDGLLVALCANGPRQQEQLKPLAETWEPLPPDTFKEQGTRVNTVLMTMRAEELQEPQEEPEKLSISYGSTTIGQAALGDDFQKRTMPTTLIRGKVDQRGTDGLPLFDPKVAHECSQERSQQQLFQVGTEAQQGLWKC